MSLIFVSHNAATISVTVPNLADLIAFVGAFESSSLGLILPAVLHTICFWDSKRSVFLRSFWLVKNVAIILLGILAFLLGLYSSLKSIGEHFLYYTEEQCIVYYLSL